MLKGIDAEPAKAVQVDLLDIERRRLQDDLVLVIMLKPVGVLAIAAVRGPPAGFYIGDVPGVRPQGPQECRGVEGACTHFKVIGLCDKTPVTRPVIMQIQYQFLEIHAHPI
jgi:hypothetical protein